MNLSPKRKEKIFNEFKSVMLDREFQRIKRSMLIEIIKLENQIIYSCFIKKEDIFNQARKETQYIKLLNTIVSSISDDIEIIFDAFNKEDFETKIIESIKVSELPPAIEQAASNECLRIHQNILFVFRYT